MPVRAISIILISHRPWRSPVPISYVCLMRSAPGLPHIIILSSIVVADLYLWVGSPPNSPTNSQHYMKIKRESAKAAAGESLPATPTKSNSRKTKSLASPKNSPKRKVEDVDDESESGTKRVTITKGHQTDRKVQEAPKSKKPKKPKKEHEEHPGLAEFFKMEEIGSSAYNVDEGDE